MVMKVLWLHDYVLNTDDNYSMMVCFVVCITIFSAQRKNASDNRYWQFCDKCDKRIKACYNLFKRNIKRNNTVFTRV